MSSIDYDSRDESQPTQESKFSVLKKLLLADERSMIARMESRLESVEDERALLDALRDRLREIEDDHLPKEEIEQRIAALEIDAEKLGRLLPIGCAFSRHNVHLSKRTR